MRGRRRLDAFIAAFASANTALDAATPAIEPIPLNRPLEAAAHIARCDHLVVVLSGFNGIDERTKIILGGLTRHNDLMLGLVTDPLAHDVRADLRITFSEGRLQVEIDSSFGPVRRSLAEFTTGRLSKILAYERKFGKAYYGNQSASVSQQHWSEAVLTLEAARHARNHAATQIKEALPPLNPQSA